MSGDDENPLVEPRERVHIPLPRDDPRALATAEVEDPDSLDQEDHRRVENLRRRVRAGYDAVLASYDLLLMPTLPVTNSS